MSGEQKRSSTTRDSGPHKLHMHCDEHRKGRDGHCSMCNRNERGRRGNRTGVAVMAKGQDGYHWLCPECVRAIGEAE